jgi:ABC-type polar amino acid transport system ATPase subunit
MARALSTYPITMLFNQRISAPDREWTSDVLDVMDTLARVAMTIRCITHEVGFAEMLDTRSSSTTA